MPIYLGHAETITVSEAEDGFILDIFTGDGTFSVNVQAAAPDLYDECKKVGAWLSDGDDARRYVTPDDMHSVHADLWDAREGK